MKNHFNVKNRIVPFAMRGYKLLMIVFSLLYFIFSPVTIFAEDSTKGQSPQKLIEIHDTIELFDTIELKVKKADGKESTIKVDRQNFETQGFKAISRTICPPPVEKISENCVKCKNNDVICKE